MERTVTKESLIESMREQIDLMKSAIQELEVMELALEISLNMDDENKTAGSNPGLEASKAFDFEGPGALLFEFETGGREDLLTLQEVDEKLGEFGNAVGTWCSERLVEGVSILCIFNDKNATVSGTALTITDEAMFCAYNGKDLRPLTSNEICRLFHFVHSHMEEIVTPEGTKPALVIRWEKEESI